MGDELTRSLSALTFSGSCSRSRGVSGISVRLDEVINRCEKGGMEREKMEINTNDHQPLKTTYSFKKTLVPG